MTSSLQDLHSTKTELKCHKLMGVAWTCTYRTSKTTSLEFKLGIAFTKQPSFQKCFLTCFILDVLLVKLHTPY